MPCRSNSSGVVDDEPELAGLVAALTGSAGPSPAVSSQSRTPGGASSNDLLACSARHSAQGPGSRAEHQCPHGGADLTSGPRQSRPSPVVWQVLWPGGLSGGGDWGLCLTQRGQVRHQDCDRGVWPHRGARWGLLRRGFRGKEGHERATSLLRGDRRDRRGQE